MITAQQKKKENYAEYIIYMWQVENLIRANECDINKIKESIIPQYKNLDKSIQLKIVDWWDNLAAMMKLEKKEQSGHLQMLINSVNELNTLHHRLLSDTHHLSYQMKFQSVAPFIKELETKMQPKPNNDIDLMLTAIYGAFILKIKGETISGGTQQALKVFGEFLAHLSHLYNEDLKGKVEWNE